MHLARWISSIDQRRFEVHLFGSGGNQWIHSELETYLDSQQAKVPQLVSRRQLIRDFWLSKAERLLAPGVLRSPLLLLKVRREGFELVHFLDFQTAGYLLTPLSRLWGRSGVTLAISNWGSDIYWYGSSKRHSKLISKVLQLVHFYTAECSRDIELARKFGYRGEAMKLLNGGGVRINSAISGLDTRRKIVVKGYQDRFGEAEDLVELMADYPEIFDGYEIVFVSTASSVKERITREIDQDRVQVSVNNYEVNRYALSSSDMSELLSQAKIFIAKSKSDGASTMALEALAEGCIPIQSPTSCLAEYLTPSILSLQPRTNTKEAFLNSIKNALALPGHEAEALAIECAEVARQDISREATSFGINEFYETATRT